MAVETKAGWIYAVRQLAAQIEEGVGGEITSESITDATDVGKSVLTAEDAEAARTAIGAGTSNLAVGSGASDAKAGNYVPTTAQVSAALSTKAEITALTELDSGDELTDVITTVNAIIAALKA